ncbi:hypothetical protein [Clostridium perfringens]|uniref:hypothetical protein n=1 Tax=Clostridium perfringens TaxID=1502 RepID=UPI0024BC499B|nr:hypothetical protein [Clostridium perfringens]EJT6154502.1 hypothetical protein [Clostridium perfringens]WEV15729.1 hypothetical protein PL325_13990 [Clostridium perfringens D]
MKKINKNIKFVILLIIILVILLSILIPLILEYCIYRNNFYSTLTNDQLASFLGSFLGGTIGGGITLIAMCITINESRKNLKREEVEKNRSYIDMFTIKSKSGDLSEVKDVYSNSKVIIDNNYQDVIDRPGIIFKNEGINFLVIENCGPSIIKEVKVEIWSKIKNKKILFINRILVNEKFFIPIVYDNFDINTNILKVNFIFKTLSNEVVLIKKEFSKECSLEDKNEIFSESSNYDYGYRYVQLKCTYLNRLSE